MKRAVLVILAAVGLVTAVVLITGGVTDDGQSSEEAFRESQYKIAGAEGCMPQDVRRRWNRLTDRYNDRFQLVVDRLPAGAGTDAERKALTSDPEFVRLEGNVRSLLATYAPGGSEYEKGCYENGIAQFKRRFVEE